MYLTGGVGAQNVGAPGGSIALTGGLSSQFSSVNSPGARVIVEGGSDFGNRSGDLYLQGGGTELLAAAPNRGGNVNVIGGGAFSAGVSGGDLLFTAGPQSNAAGTQGSVVIDCGGGGVGTLGTMDFGAANAGLCTIGRTGQAVAAPGRINVGSTVMAVADGDLAAGLAGAGNSQLAFDQSGKTLSITAGTLTDDLVIRLGPQTPAGAGHVTLRADGNSAFTIQ